MFKRIITSAAFVSCFFLPSALLWAQTGYQWQQEAKRLEELKDYKGAVEALQKAIKLGTDSKMYDAMSRRNLARVYWKAGEHQKSIEQAKLFLKMADDPEVSSELRRFTKFDNRVFKYQAYEIMGFVYDSTREPEKAIQAFETALRFQHDEGLARAVARLKEGQDRARAANLRRAELVAKAEEAERSDRVREALDLYREALKHGTWEISIAKKVIELAKSLDPPPAIPEEARKHAAYGATAARIAKDDEGLDNAIVEYTKALTMAPWWTDLHVNTALLLEQRKRYQEAIWVLSLYLDADADAKDKDQIKNKLHELEYLMRSSPSRQ
jgi:tetratricopeptide (TPR) repeat protein